MLSIFFLADQPEGSDISDDSSDDDYTHQVQAGSTGKDKH